MYRAVVVGFAAVLGGVLPIWSYSHAWGFQPALSVTLIFGALSILHAMKLF